MGNKVTSRLFVIALIASVMVLCLVVETSARECSAVRHVAFQTGTLHASLTDCKAAVDDACRASTLQL
jgi:hypothetical protein